MPSFGDLSNSKVATLGLNPSNREFVDHLGKQLDGVARRFHTLQSLGLSHWSEANDTHVQLIVDSCRGYFQKNPYDGWFKKLNDLISGTNASYYDESECACHLDLIPYATACKWTQLSSAQRSALLRIAGDTLSLLLSESPVRVLILNGNTVVKQFEHIAGISLKEKQMPSWSLPRRDGSGVPGFAYRGTVRHLSGLKLNHDILVLGFNHNIQSSFGVTKGVVGAIRNWLRKSTEETLS